MKFETTNPDYSSVYMTVPEVAQLLKMKERTVREWCYSKYIPHYKRRGKLLFKLNEILAWMERENKVDPIVNPPLRRLKNQRNPETKPPPPNR